MKEECWKDVSDNRLSSNLFSSCWEQEQRDREETKHAEKMTETVPGQGHILKPILIKNGDCNRIQGSDLMCD